MHAITRHRHLVASMTVAATCLAVPVPVTTQESGTGLEVTAPRQIEVVVEPLEKAAAGIGLTGEGIATRVRSRLAKAGLEPDGENLPHYLLVDVDVVGRAFTARLAFARAVTYRADARRYRTFTATWTTAGTGAHGRDPDYVDYVVATLVNEFLRAYLSANFPAERSRLPAAPESPDGG